MNDKINIKLLLSVLVVIALAVAVIYNTLKIANDTLDKSTDTDTIEVTTEQTYVEETTPETIEEVYTEDTTVEVEVTEPIEYAETTEDTQSTGDGYAVSISNGNNNIYIGEIHTDSNVNIDVDGLEISTGDDDSYINIDGININN